MVKDLVPNYEFLPWKFNSIAKNFWNKAENRKRYVLWLGNQLNFKKPEDWYLLTIKMIKDNHGASLLTHYYDSSPLKMISESLPQLELKPWLFKKAQSSFWSKDENIKDYVLWLGKTLGYKKKDDWYQVQRKDFKNHSGFGLLDKLTPREILELVYPEQNWIPWKFGNLTGGYWLSRENRVKYLNWLATKLSIKETEGWYSIKPEDLQNNYGGGFFVYYKNDRLALVRDLLPDFNWQPWLFKTSPKNLWTSENQEAYMEFLAEKLNIEKYEDWYQVGVKDIHAHGGNGLLTSYYRGSPALLIMSLMPGYAWEPHLFSQRQKSQQKLFKVIEKLFPDSIVEYNFKSSELHFKKSGRIMEIDIYIPELRLGFEYQGEQHYFPIEFWGGRKSFLAQKKRDAEKKAAAKEAGIVLIDIPYTWDRTDTEIKMIIGHEAPEVAIKK